MNNALTLNELMTEILKFRGRLISNAMSYYEPNIVVYLTGEAFKDLTSDPKIRELTDFDGKYLHGYPIFIVNCSNHRPYSIFEQT